MLWWRQFLLQVVCTSTIALGSRGLAEKQAIVSRLASIEALVGMDMLCSGKTDTLTLNITTIESKLPWGQISKQQWLLFAFLATKWTQYAKDAIGTMLFKCKNVVQAILDRHTSVDYTRGCRWHGTIGFPMCLTASASDVVVVSGATDRTGLVIYKVLGEREKKKRKRKEKKKTERECPRLLSERHKACERLG